MTEPNPARFMSTPRAAILLAILALIGTALSVALSQHFYEIRSGAGGFNSYCHISATMNCDAVAASPYAELVAGLPISSFGAGWFLGLFVLALFARNPFWRREAVRAAFGMSLLGTVLSLGYLLLMATVIKTFCLLCLGVDAISLACLVTTLTLHPEGLGKHKPDASKWKIFGLVVAGSLAVVVLALTALDRSNADASEINTLAQSVIDTPPVSISDSDSFPSIGPKSAPVTIVEFSDFQCPYCRMGAVTLNSVINRYPDKVRIVFRNYPLDPSCNKNMEHGGHQFACDAARTALCANKQGKFLATYELLFEKQATFAPGRPVALAKEAGADVDSLKGCMAAPETEMAIARDVTEGTTLGVQSTPTFFVNGRKVPGALPLPFWNKVIELLLAGK